MIQGKRTQNPEFEPNENMKTRRRYQGTTS